ncbi:hypothetical protein [Sorangium sp. So ce861]|uniref:hypothetical protein n=1 Tax=Sorangium sp. So ce861 TaxID=3133323 RepID=UPI003F5EBD8D
MAGTGGSDPTGGGDTTLVGVAPPGADWACRQREISEMIQHHETGPKQIKETTVHGSSA